MKIQSVNVLKFIMAIFVIATHTLCLTGMSNFVTNSPLIVFILRIAVPVFFIISGFLLFRKMDLRKDGVNDKRMGKSILRVLILYVIFYLVYSVIAWYVAKRAGIGFGDFMGYQIRKFLFVGESAYSWALWYLHGLILATLLIWGILKLFPKIKPSAFLILAVVVWGAGIIIEAIGSEKMGAVPGYNLFITLFERVQRNGIFTGFPFVAIGLWLSQTKNLKAWSGWLCVIAGLIFGLVGADFGRMILAIGVVILVLQVKLKDRKIYNYMGFASRWMFLLHMAFLFIYVVLIKHRTDSTMGGYEWGLFGFVLGCSLISATILWLISGVIKPRIGNKGKRSRCKKLPKLQRLE